ncbi:MAG: hypothetical protein QOJ68_771, partial [Blastococcus sp.]|nr:hypothetical protein [Blastococcus sp.]
MSEPRTGVVDVGDEPPVGMSPEAAATEPA